MNKNYLGHEYFCSICKDFFISSDDLLDEVELQHVNGEQLSIITISCPHCGSMSLPEGMNTIAWLKTQSGENNEHS